MKGMKSANAPLFKGIADLVLRACEGMISVYKVAVAVLEPRFYVSFDVNCRAFPRA